MKVTLRQIQTVLRSENRTAIFALCSKMGLFAQTDKSKHSIVFDFIKSNAPTQKLRRKAYDLAYSGRIKYPEFWYDGLLPINREVEFAKQQRKNAGSPYQKTIMRGNTHAWWCSPVYGHSDYNKSRAFRLKENEKLFALLYAYMNK